MTTKTITVKPTHLEYLVAEILAFATEPKLGPWKWTESPAFRDAIYQADLARLALTVHGCGEAAHKAYGDRIRNAHSGRDVRDGIQLAMLDLGKAVQKQTQALEAVRPAPPAAPAAARRPRRTVFLRDAAGEIAETISIE